VPGECAPFSIEDLRLKIEDLGYSIFQISPSKSKKKKPDYEGLKSTVLIARLDLVLKPSIFLYLLLSDFLLYAPCSLLYALVARNPNLATRNS
jgi:hypothetical protein